MNTFSEPRSILAPERELTREELEALIAEHGQESRPESRLSQGGSRPESRIQQQQQQQQVQQQVVYNEEVNHRSEEQQRVSFAEDICK